MNSGISKLRKILYCGGSAGFSIMDTIFGTFFVYFLLPPAESGLPELISKKLYFGISITALIIIFGRFIDSVTDPMIANWSDNSSFKIGRRRFFMLAGSFPFFLFTVLIFFTPGNTVSTANIIYETIIVGFYFFFYTFFMNPYLAVIPEISDSHSDRIFLTSLQALFLLIGAGFIMLGSPILLKLVEPLTATKRSAFQISILIPAIAGFVLMAISGLAVKEKKSDASVNSGMHFMKSLIMTLKNRNFIYYMMGIIMYWCTFHIIRTLIPYYPVVLLNADEGMQSVLFGVLFGSAVPFFVIISFLSKKFTNKTIIISGLVIFSLVSAITYFIDIAGSFRLPLVMIQMALFGYPVSVLLVIPNAIVADICEIDAFDTGTRREAMFFGTQGFFMKVIYGSAVAIVIYLFSIFGKDASNPMGIKLSGFLGSIFSLAGIFLMLKHPQKNITESIRRIRS